jgi:hypothetical protein
MRSVFGLKEFGSARFMMEKRARNARVPIVGDSLILHTLDFNIYAVTNLAPITGTHSQI